MKDRFQTLHSVYVDCCCGAFPRAARNLLFSVAWGSPGEEFRKNADIPDLTEWLFLLARNMYLFDRPVTGACPEGARG